MRLLLAIILFCSSPSLGTGYLDTYSETLTVPGTTTAVETTVNNLVTFQYTVANINTSVDVRFEGSLDGVDYFNLAADGSDTTISANGTYAAAYTGVIKLKYVRVRFVSETGGTDATISIVIGHGE